MWPRWPTGVQPLHTGEARLPRAWGATAPLRPFRHRGGPASPRAGSNRPVCTLCTHGGWAGTPPVPGPTVRPTGNGFRTVRRPRARGSEPKRIPSPMTEFPEATRAGERELPNQFGSFFGPEATRAGERGNPKSVWDFRLPGGHACGGASHSPLLPRWQQRWRPRARGGERGARARLTVFPIVGNTAGTRGGPLCTECTPPFVATCDKRWARAEIRCTPSVQQRVPPIVPPWTIGEVTSFAAGKGLACPILGIIQRGFRGVCTPLAGYAWRPAKVPF